MRAAVACCVSMVCLCCLANSAQAFHIHSYNHYRASGSGYYGFGGVYRSGYRPAGIVYRSAYPAFGYSYAPAAVGYYGAPAVSYGYVPAGYGYGYSGFGYGAGCAGAAGYGYGAGCAGGTCHGGGNGGGTPSNFTKKEVQELIQTMHAINGKLDGINDKLDAIEGKIDEIKNKKNPPGAVPPTMPGTDPSTADQDTDRSLITHQNRAVRRYKSRSQSVVASTSSDTSATAKTEDYPNLNGFLKKFGSEASPPQDAPEDYPHLRSFLQQYGSKNNKSGS